MCVCGVCVCVGVGVREGWALYIYVLAVGLQLICPCSYIHYFPLGEFDFSILTELLCSLLYHWVRIHDQMSLNNDVGPGNGLVLSIPQTIP